MAKKIGAVETHDLAAAFGLLGDQTRLKVVLHLAGGAQNVSALCELLNVNQPALSHHLKLLRMGRLVLHRRVGKQAAYTLNVERLGDTLRQLNAALHA